MYRTDYGDWKNCYAQRGTDRLSLFYTYVYIDLGLSLFLFSFIFILFVLHHYTPIITNFISFLCTDLIILLSSVLLIVQFHYLFIYLSISLSPPLPFSTLFYNQDFILSAQKNIRD